MFPLSPTISAGLACRLAGIPKTDRLRSWHTRDGLHVGAAEAAGQKRRYSFADVVLLRLVNELSRAISTSTAIAIAMEHREAVVEHATIMNIMEVAPVLVVSIDADEERVPDGFHASKLIFSVYGEAGPEALKASDGPSVAVVLNLGRCIWRTQKAYEELLKFGSGGDFAD